MKKTIYALVLVWVVGFSVDCFAGEESWETLVNNSNVGLGSAVANDGSSVVGYNDSENMYFTLVKLDKDGVITKTIDVKHEKYSMNFDVRLTGLSCSVEGGQNYTYVIEERAYTTSTREGVVRKYDSDLNQVWMTRLNDFRSLRQVLVMNEYVFLAGLNQGSSTTIIGWTRISFDGVVDTNYTVHSDIQGYPMKVLQVGSEAVIFGYRMQDTAKTIGINLSSGQMLWSKDYYSAGTYVVFVCAEKIFINGAHTGYVVSGEKGYNSDDRKYMLFVLDLNGNLVSQREYDVPVWVDGTDGYSFIVVTEVGDDIVEYHKMNYPWNDLGEYEFMNGFAGGIVKINEAYFAFGHLSAGTGTYVRYYKPNHPPVADAGDDQIVSEGATVQLVGTGSDPDDTDLVYFWTQVYGPTVALIVATANDVSFIAPTVGPDGATLEFQLSASDGSLSDTDTLVVHVTNVNQSPVAYAGPDLTEDEGVAVTLAGSGNDPDGDAMTYQWTQTSGPAVILTHAATNHPSFTTPQVDADGVTLTFELTVSDGVLSTTDTCVVNVTYENEVPQAGAGDDQTATEGETVTLAGAGADPDGHDVTYQWTQVSGPAVLLVNPDTAHPTFTAPGVDHSGAALAFQLTVSDGNLTATDTCVVNVTYDNQVPLSDAGNDQAVDENANVTLSGTGSDPDGEDVTFLWTQISGTTVTLINSTSGTASFTAPSVGESGGVLTFRLTVSDGSLAKTDTCTITVNNVAGVDPDPDPDPDPDDDDDDPAEKSDGGGGGGCFIGSLM